MSYLPWLQNTALISEQFIWQPVLHLYTVDVGFRMDRYAVRGIMGERE